MRVLCMAVLMAAACAVTVPSHCADGLDGVIQQINAGGWGLDRDAMKNALEGSILLSNEEIVIAPWKFGGHSATVNYLFTRDGRLYNLSWYTTYPLEQIGTARSLKGGMDRTLARKYGKAARTDVNGDFRQFKTVAANMEQLEQERRDAYRDYKKMREEKAGEDEMKAQKELLIELLPSSFYREMTFWDGGEIWLYTMLDCTTDGACYLHLQAAAKSLTERLEYVKVAEDALNTALLEGETKRVAKHNKTWISRLRQYSR